MAESAVPVTVAEGSGSTETSINEAPSDTDGFSEAVQVDSSSATPVIEHMSGTLEIHVDEGTYDVVEELGTRHRCASEYSTAVMEQGTSVICDQPIVQDDTTEREDCSVMDVDGSAGFMEQGASSNDLLVEQESTAESQTCATIDSEGSTAVVHIEQESSTNEPAIEHLTEQVETVTYHVLEKGSKRARKKLVDSNGYGYNIKSHSPVVTYWQCNRRPKGNRCKASIVQRGDLFRPGKFGHNHSADAEKNAHAAISARVKQQALRDPLKSAVTIVKEVLLEEFGGLPAPDWLKPNHLARNANRARQFPKARGNNILWPKPDNLAFELDEDHVPARFLREDIVKQGRRYLVFATEEQIRLLSKAKSWYIDESAKFCQEPFEKLVTISAFVAADSDAKQVPLVFALMSGSERKDYRKVIKKILGLVPSPPSVREVTAYFEEALWAELRRALPEVELRGCVLHWLQAAWKAIQELQLQKKYHNDNETSFFLRKVMALPFLPEEEIQPMFVRLWVQASTAPLQLFIQYISSAWIYNTTWPPSTWSVFNTAVRTYKDAERWHQNLNRRLPGGTPMSVYLLINLLYQEASEITPLHVKPLSERKLKKIRMQKNSNHLAKFFIFWEEYKNKTKSVAQLLKACSDVSGLISFYN